MAPLDDTGLPPVSADSPTGENLELDPDFGALERAAQGKPETQYGNTVEPAVPPDWKEAASIAESLLQRTHDLRVMVHLATARLHLNGIPEFASVVRQIRRVLDEYWEQVHPQLDPEDDNDPMQRSNAVLQLQDAGRVLRPMRDTTLATTPRTGPVTWRDLAVLAGAIEADPNKEKLTEAVVAAAFAGTDASRLKAVRDAVDGLLDDVPGISAAFDMHGGVGTGPNYDDLTKLLREIKRDLKRYEKTEAPVFEEEMAEEAPASDSGSASTAEVRTGRGFASIQAITALTKRDDAVHALELASTYFRVYEPSSPLPMLLDRAKRLASMDFMDILRDLAPDGLSQAQVIAGPNGME